MPLILAPFAAGGCLGRDLGERLVIDNENLVRLRIGFAGEVSVIVSARVLEPEEQAKVPVPVVATRLHQFCFEEEIAETSSREQRDAARGADLVRVAAVSNKFECGSARVRVSLPGFGIGKLQLLEDSVVAEVRLPLKRESLGDMFGFFDVGALRATAAAQEERSQ